MSLWAKTRRERKFNFCIFINISSSSFLENIQFQKQQSTIIHHSVCLILETDKNTERELNIIQRTSKKTNTTFFYLFDYSSTVFCLL